VTKIKEDLTNLRQEPSNLLHEPWFRDHQSEVKINGRLNPWLQFEITKLNGPKALKVQQYLRQQGLVISVHSFCESLINWNKRAHQISIKQQKYWGQLRERFFQFIQKLYKNIWLLLRKTGIVLEHSNQTIFSLDFSCQSNSSVLL